MNERREIKFRARIIRQIRNGGDWIYWGLAGTDMLDSVDLDTLGEFTGLKDKNGKEIYEGDIITHDRHDSREAVKWDADMGAYRMPDEFSGDEYVFLGQVDAEVIGNIYENPELLKA